MEEFHHVDKLVNNASSYRQPMIGPTEALLQT